MKQATPQRFVLFQEITVRWHKASRGAPGAIARNRVPETYALPANPPSTSWPTRLSHLKPRIVPPADAEDDRAADIYLHHVYFGEDNQFQTPHRQYWIALRSHLPEPSTLQLPYANVPPLTLTGVDDTLQAQFEWSGAGAPLRSYRSWREEATLATGQWLQVRYNGRHCYTEDGTWYYEKHVLNIAWSETLYAARFTAASPDYKITDFADLH